jgi:hypothetical protein
MECEADLCLTVVGHVLNPTSSFGTACPALFHSRARGHRPKDTSDYYADGTIVCLVRGLQVECSIRTFMLRRASATGMAQSPRRVMCKADDPPTVCVRMRMALALNPHHNAERGVGET